MNIPKTSHTRRTINETPADPLREEIAKLERENRRLQASVESWKNAWYEQRKWTGDHAWWRHKLGQAYRQLKATCRVTNGLLFDAAHERDLMLEAKHDG